LNFSIGAAVAGNPVAATVLFGYAGQADTHTASINWGDGAVGEMLVDQMLDSATASHVYDHAGQYTLLVTIVDDDGAAVEASLDVLIREDFILLLPLIER
jgi:hypothetical protein